MYNDNNEFRSMKRAHSPDSSFDSNQSFRGGHQHFRGQFQHHHHNSHHHPFNKRHRGEYGYHQYSPQTIEEKISRLGDTGSRTLDIGMLAKEIDEEVANRNNDDEKVKNITSQICKSIMSFPNRIATYSTLIGLISVKHYNVSCQIMDILHASYPVYLEAQKWQEALTIMHVLANLVNCKVIQADAILSQFESFIEIANEPNIPQTRSDYFVYTVMSSLPYVAQELSLPTEPPNKFENLLSNIETYLNGRSKEHLSFIRVWQSNDSTVQMDYLDSLWVQMKNFRANNWTETFLPRPYNDKEYKDIMTSSLIPRASPLMQVPPHNVNNVYPTPRIVFRIYDDDVVDEEKSIPGSDKIERFCIENHIKTIIEEIPSDAKVAVRHMIQMHRNESLPIKHLLIETILGELFNLPKMRQDELYYRVLLFELTRMFRKNKDPKLDYDFILNEAVKVLYQNLETMNVTCYSRFVEWFSFHLNNLDFLYPWVTWQDAEMDKDKTSVKALFVYEVLDRCIRYSFHKKISTMVKVSLPNLIPPEVGITYNPVFAHHPSAQGLAAAINKLILEKADDKTMINELNIIDDQAQESEERLLKIDIFTSVILHIASKSLTHISSAIGKYRNVIKALVKEGTGQVQLLHTMNSCLETHPQLQIILVEKLLKADLVAAREVCNWIFSETMRKNYLKSYPWEILNNTILRLKQVVNKLKKEIDEPILVEEPVTTVVKIEKRDGSGTPNHPEDGDQVEESTKDDQTDTEANKDVEMRADTQEQIQNRRNELQLKLDEANTNLHQVLLLIFTLFSENVSQHKKASEAEGLDHRDKWFKWFSGRMQQIYYNHYDTVRCHEDIMRIIMDNLN